MLIHLHKLSQLLVKLPLQLKGFVHFIPFITSRLIPFGGCRFTGLSLLESYRISLFFYFPSATLTATTLSETHQRFGSHGGLRRALQDNGNELWNLSNRKFFICFSRHFHNNTLNTVGDFGQASYCYRLSLSERKNTLPKQRLGVRFSWCRYHSSHGRTAHA